VRTPLTVHVTRPLCGPGHPAAVVAGQGSRSTVPDGPWRRRVRVRAISRQEANPSPMASGGADPPRFAPPHDTGTDARRTADGSVPADTTPPPPHAASNFPDPAAAATATGDLGASHRNAIRRAEQSAVAELTTLARTLDASIRELRADVTTLHDPTGAISMSTASGPRPTDPTPANTPASRDRHRSRRSAASTSPLASRSAGARSDPDARSSRSANDDEPPRDPSSSSSSSYST